MPELITEAAPAAFTPYRPAGPQRSPRLSQGLRDTLTMIGRSLRLTRRHPDALLTSLMLPILLMLLFVYLFGGAIHTGGSYVNYVVPGVLVLCTAFGASTTAVTVCQDMTGGIIDRFRSLDVGGAAIICGHVVSSVLRNIASTMLVFGVAFAIGFRPAAGFAGWLGAMGVLLMLILALSWLSAAIGMFTKSPDAASGLTFIAAFLPYASSGFVPIHTMPVWLRGFARDQPVTPVINSIRGLLMHTPMTPWTLQLALAWCGGIVIVSVALVTVLFRRRTG